MPLWILGARLEEKAGSLIKARSTLEKARLLNAKHEALWLESVRVERRGENEAMAKHLMAKGACVVSGRASTLG